jgi:hypothetical protein
MVLYMLTWPSTTARCGLFLHAPVFMMSSPKAVWVPWWHVMKTDGRWIYTVKTQHTSISEEATRSRFSTKHFYLWKLEVRTAGSLELAWCCIQLAVCCRKSVAFILTGMPCRVFFLQKAVLASQVLRVFTFFLAASYWMKTKADFLWFYFCLQPANQWGNT